MKGRIRFPENEAGRRVSRSDGGSHGYMEGVRSFSDGNFQIASRRFQALLVSQPRTQKLLIAAGHAALHDNDPIRALGFYRDAERLGELPPEVLYNMALLALNNEEHDRACTLFRRVLDAKVSFHPGQFYLGLFFESPAEFLCDTALYLARSHRDSGRLAQARDTYLEALKHDERNVTALQALGELALLSRNYIDATRYLTRILSLSSLEEDLINAHNNLAIALYENGAIEEAIEHLKWVLTHSPANPTAVQNLHHIFEKEGVFRDVGSHGSIRFMDVAEGAQPIFQLTEESNRQPDGEAIGGGRVIIGKSAEMLRVMRHARVAASSESTVLLRGENGTGKQLLAEMIARNSARRDGPFITLETTSVPDMQLVSELFGHEKGAFTGARARKAGAFEQAAGGTLFLDDVAGLSPLMQGKLFRALHDKRFTPVGGREMLDLDVRLIAGTNRDLATLMREGAFRQDLFYILNVIYIEVPPLRERKADIPLLVDYFLAKHARSGRAPVKLPEEEMPTLLDYDWPGNVRELENLVERAVVMGSQSSLFIEELARLRKGRSKESQSAASSDAVTYPINMTLAELEKAHILSVLQSVDHNQRQAAKLLGINPSTLWRKLKLYGEEEQAK